MLNKVCSLAGALGILLAIVGGFVAIPNLNAGLALVVLGIIAGITAPDESVPRTGMATIALPVAATALAAIPMLGEQLAGVATGLAAVAAGSFSCSVLIRVVKMAIASFTSLTAKA
jgi:hypothetical protein